MSSDPSLADFILGPGQKNDPTPEQIKRVAARLRQLGQGNQPQGEIMSWSVTMIGRPEKVAAELEGYGATLSGQSKEEYEATAPHLAALVRQNISENVDFPMLVTINASGHGSAKDGKLVQNCVSVDLKYSYAKILV